MFFKIKNDESDFSLSAHFVTLAHYSVVCSNQGDTQTIGEAYASYSTVDGDSYDWALF